MDIPALKQQPQINTFANLMRGVTGAINNVREPVQNTLFNLLSGAYADRLLNKMGMEQPTINQLRQEMNSPEVQMAMSIMPIGMIAYHGSPHTFDKFSLDKIGTGEGAQAYGHGLYMAESPDVAKSYADELGQLEILHNNKVVGVFDKDPAANAAHQIRATGGDVDKAIKRAQNIYTGAWRDNVVNEIKKLGPGEVSERVNGSMYKVDIPDEAVARMLDWDKPLSEQAPEVIEMLKKSSNPDLRKALDQSRESTWMDDFLPRSGKDAYHNIATRLSRFPKAVDFGDIGAPKLATKHLQELGIPGIRYLDGGSRGAGTGTSNFVVFDPDMIRILERNGISTGQQPWKPGEWK